MKLRGLIAVHAVHLQAEEIDLLARHGCSGAHCPSSNLKLASGFAPQFFTKNALNLLWFASIFVLSLPQSVILWTEPEPLSDSDGDGARPARVVATS